MIRVEVTVDDDILRAIEDAAKTSPARMKTAYRRAVGRLRGRILQRLGVEPGKPVYPLRWKSEKQRRAYFATDGFGAGIPYHRTGRMLSKTDVKLIDSENGGILAITNTDPKARFVIGDDAQPFHLDTGWVQIAAVASDARVEAEEVLIQTWFTVADAFGGVPR